MDALERDDQKVTIGTDRKDMTEPKKKTRTNRKDVAGKDKWPDRHSYKMTK